MVALAGVRPIKYVAATALIVGATLVPAEPATASTPTLISVIYSGTYKFQYDYSGPTTHQTFSYELSWKMHVSEPPGQSNLWKMDTLTGSVQFSLTGLGTNTKCSATLSWDGQQTSVGGNVFFTGNGYTVDLRIPYLNAVATPANDLCSSTLPDLSGYESDQAKTAALAKVETPQVTFPAKGSHTQPLDFSWHCPDSGCPFVIGPGGTGSLTLKSQIDFASPGSGSGSPKVNTGQSGAPTTSLPSSTLNPKKPTYEQKVAAQKDLKKAIDQAKPPCVRLGAGVTAGVWASTVSAGALAAGVTAAILTAGSAKECAELVKRAYDDAKIVNDPPTSHIFAVASPRRRSHEVALPACKAGPELTYCRHLRADYTDFLDALHKVRTVDDALMKTVDRESAAYTHRTTKALSVQKAAAERLSRHLRSALSAQRSAGQMLAALVDAAGVRGHLSAKVSKKATAAVLGHLTRLGVSRKELDRLGAGSALKGAPENVLHEIAG